ncbi:hypothetical protein PG997_014279 [Apiospora hydei]|uniref:Uncharacterized protein n=1 Tax=Apiospora hydei TaxID=1337664 RepID=A0ABR1UU08_9PEZI
MHCGGEAVGVDATLKGGSKSSREALRLCVVTILASAQLFWVTRQLGVSGENLVKELESGSVTALPVSVEEGNSAAPRRRPRGLERRWARGSSSRAPQRA